MMSNESTEVDVEEVENQEIEQEAQPKPNSTFLDFDVIKDPEQRQKFEDRTKKDWKSIKNYERKLQEEQKRIHDLEQKLLEANKPKHVDMPTADEFDVNYEAATRKMQQYGESLTKNQEWNQRQQQLEQQANIDAQNAIKGKIDTFVDRANRAGIENTALENAATLAAKALSDEVQNFVMDHDLGPQILMKLSDNPTTLNELASLSPVEAGMKIGEISRAFAKRTQPNATPPDKPLSGSGAPPNEFPLSSGGTFS